MCLLWQLSLCFMNFRKTFIGYYGVKERLALRQYSPSPLPNDYGNKDRFPYLTCLLNPTNLFSLAILPSLERACYLNVCKCSVQLSSLHPCDTILHSRILNSSHLDMYIFECIHIPTRQCLVTGGSGGTSTLVIIGIYHTVD